MFLYSLSPQFNDRLVDKVCFFPHGSGEDIHETESDRSEQLEDSDDLSDFIVDDDAVEYNSTASSGLPIKKPFFLFFFSAC